MVIRLGAVKRPIVNLLVAGNDKMFTETGILHHGSRVSADQHRLVGNKQVVIVKGEGMGEAWHGAFIDGNLSVVFADVFQVQFESTHDPIGKRGKTHLGGCFRVADGELLLEVIPVIIAAKIPQEPSEIFAIYGSGNAGKGKWFIVC